MEKKKIAKELSLLFVSYFKETPEVYEIKGGGSTRKYFRLKSLNSLAIGAYCADIKENIDFFNLRTILHNAGLAIPEIFSISPDRKMYLLEDLGDTQLLDLLSGPDKMKLAEKALNDLLIFQNIPESQWKDKVGYKPFSHRLVMWDLNYFKYDFLKPAGIAFDEEKLEEDFINLSKEILSSDTKIGLMYRDFQSRNIMVKNGKFYFIDFQGARKGPVFYDLVSFVWQAKAPFTYEERESLGNYYISFLSGNDSVSDDLQSQLYMMQVFRTLQVLGAYGFRGLIEKKAHFLESLPYAVRNLKYLANKGRLDKFPELKKIAFTLDETRFEKEKPEEGKLTLKIFSFSYKKGYPEDKTGNGGGFMFDCRAIENPGRYEPYKNKTGKDVEVIEFLERTDEAGNFVKNCVELVKPSVERYLKRGFTSLQVGFGCTGGQHRSVYCAEKFAEIIGKEFPQVKIILTHREQQ